MSAVGWDNCCLVHLLIAASRRVCVCVGGGGGVEV